MRTFLPLALVLAFALPAEAQQQPLANPAAPTMDVVETVPDAAGPRAPEQAPTLRSPKVPVQPAPAQQADGAAPVVQNELQTRAVEAMDARQGAPGTARWWWLVAALVVAGLIIVAIT